MKSRGWLLEVALQFVGVLKGWYHSKGILAVREKNKIGDYPKNSRRYAVIIGPSDLGEGTDDLAQYHRIRPPTFFLTF